ncbi:M48 family metallopeptidase [Aquimarina litoralis]|uniref:M48 family metallopeptidase n=1 Tax=Aquimarina litoralis TaxID=584605 RepID=UPI001C570CA8|nr:M48 family metallopeptidase [Aquimarina litoralis]MBW1298138.1 M48 family metalloprotease [Aquimarina litoralis]
MKSLYSKSSHAIPEGLTKPSSSFKKFVWLSVLGLLLFIIIYITLIIWFGRLAYYSFLEGGALWNYILAGGYAFLCLFMIKSLFIFNKREKNPLDLFITEKEEPILFDYLYQLADEAGAPRPKKVFLSPRVNASVSYDLSIINLIFPSKKNLEIGLGLMNVLSLGEFKAVLAHEFGHFAQRSMLLGRYVYVAQQIAVQIINKRDIFDNFLAGISSIDIRIAWIGWILSILVWAVRSLIETCFSVVIIAQRALSREMEFQADLVAVSLTGSDALIHALSKLQIADEAYDHALNTVNTKLDDKKAIYNLFKLQTNYIEKMSWVLDDPMYGKSPKVLDIDPELHRVFGNRAFNPPKMWSTHPADKDREENAKKIYISAPIDERPAEILLSDATKYEVEMTARLIATAKVESEVISDEESLKFQNKEYFSWTFLDPKYRSNFLNRFFTLSFKDIDEMYAMEIAKNDISSNFKSIYQSELTEKLEALKEVKEEILSLNLIINEAITIEKREIWHRGEQIKRKDVKTILQKLEQEESLIIEDLKKHDTLCRSTYYKAATHLDSSWSDYLKSVSNLVHYSEHAIADIQDAARKYHNVVNIALADGNISSDELTDIVNSGNDYYKSIRSAFQKSKEIKLNKELLANSTKETFADFFEEFKLSSPTSDNISKWSEVVDGWAGEALNGLNFLRNSSLEHLLDIEEEIKTSFLNNTPINKAQPAPINTVNTYKLLTRGNERPIQRKLKLWDRFILGEGFFGATAKFAISITLIGGALFLGSFSQSTDLTIYNGLEMDVTIMINEDKELEIKAKDNHTISVDHNTDYSITAYDPKGEIIENFTESTGSPGKEYIYNVANSGAFFEYTAYYGSRNGSVPEQRNIGSARWFHSYADYILKTPPQMDDEGTRKDVLVAYSDNPYDMISLINDSTELKKLINTHILWDSADSDNILSWMSLLQFVDDPNTIIDKRINRLGNDIIAKRAKMDMVDDDEKNKICNEIQQSFQQKTNSADLYYLNTRCLEDSEYQDKTFVEGYEKWPKHPWLAYAAANIYAQNENWKKSLKAFNQASSINGLKSAIALNAERVRRKIGKDSGSLQLEFTTEDLEYYLNVDKGRLDRLSNDPYYAYVLISKGKLDEAYQFIQAYNTFKPYVLRYLAVSEGASDEIKNAVKLLDKEEGINNSSIWYTLAWNILEKKEYDKIVSEIDYTGVSSSDLNKFITFIKSKDYAAAENIIKKQRVYFKGYMYALGHIISKFKAPENWKNNADQLLFAHEQPFLGN